MKFGLCIFGYFHERFNFLVIILEECIDCTLSKQWSVIDKMKEPFTDLKKWNGMSDKLQYLNKK